MLAEDPETGEQGYFEVVALTSHPEDEILHITIEAEAEAEENSLDTTPNLTDNDDQQPNKNDHQSPHLQSPNLLQVTPEHPIYVEGQGWLWAENLSIGDTLRRADGGTAKVLAIERVKLDAPQLVYNFTVKGPHTYFVLEVGVLVHNDRPDCGLFEGYEPEPGDGGFVYKKRTVEKVPLHFENIPDTTTGVKNALGWEVTEPRGIQVENGARMLQVKVKTPDGLTGSYKRGFHEAKKQFIFEAGFTRDLPSWARHDFEISSRGTPTGAFFTEYIMKRLEIPNEAIERVKMSTIVNSTTALQLKWLRRRFPGISDADLIKYTHSVSYAKTTLTQAGYQIVPGKFKVKHMTAPPGMSPHPRLGTIVVQTIRNRLAPDELAVFDDLMRKLNIKKSDRVPYGFDIEFEVTPIR